MVCVSLRSITLSATSEPRLEPGSGPEVFTSLLTGEPSAIRSRDRSIGTGGRRRDGDYRPDDDGHRSAGDPFEAGLELTVPPDHLPVEAV